MESPVKGRLRKKNFLIKTWERCRTIPSSAGVSGFCNIRKKKVAPEGFFPVYVGPEKQWFAVKTQYANHPLFRMLLEDAEVEYGYDTPGPILLPCEVDLFYRVVAEMETMEMEPRKLRYGSCSPFNPSRRLINAGGDQMVKGYGGYGLLTPSRLVKMN
ncbi:auxin-responsive protein SAUR26 [Lactuca sativa]|uniref:auxin-responsive protein SAUR26 n=1 Tax=Lactuca sativa TaxID=4236 RepID=UPI000CB95B13|nr:auxin-responsive protein SAUR26 [Lactuca sativa]